MAPIMKEEENDATLVQLQSACSDLKDLMQTSANMQQSLSEMDKRFDVFGDNISVASKRIAPLQSSAMITKALETRINRAVSPALALLDSFKLSDTLQHKLLELSSNSPEEIDEMEWESLETAISLWIQHFALAVQNVLVSEKRLCNKVLDKIMDGQVWPECFVKISDKIMAVFFRFGEGVSRTSKEPQKLFKLLDMFDSLEKIKPHFSEVFEDEAGEDICIRFRELEKLLIHASSKVFWEFGLQIEESSDMIPPPQDGSVPKLVRYAINYLKLTTVHLGTPLQT